jgi:hypothetical protein
MIDRIDLFVQVPSVSLKELRSSAGECSETVARRVVAALKIQMHRCGRLNAALGLDTVRSPPERCHPFRHASGSVYKTYSSSGEDNARTSAGVTPCRPMPPLAGLLERGGPPQPRTDVLG